MRAAVLLFPGLNREGDAMRALEQASGVKPILVWHAEHELPAGTDVVVVPGGFSYGDYLRAGAIARFSPIMQEVIAFAKRGGPVLGICNGFQIACEAGLLPGALLRNASLRFVSAPVHLRVESIATRYTSQYHIGQVISIPVAHGDGRYTADADTLARLEGEGQVVFRYVSAEGEATSSANPNGSLRNIAGIVSAEGNVLGMMPHPERALDATLGSTDGVPLFASILESMLAEVKA